MLSSIISSYNEAIIDTDRSKAMQVINNALGQGMLPEDVIFKVIIPSIEKTMKSVSETGEINLAQHFISSQIAAEATEILIEKFKKAPEVIGCVVMGTSRGDFHGLGKRIVMGCLKAQMIETVDLGLNVSPHQFVDKALAHKAQIIGISSMMLHTARGLKGSLKVREILKERGLEDKIKIVVGGAPYRYDPNLYKIVQADAWAENGIEAGTVIQKLIHEVKSFDRD